MTKGDIYVAHDCGWRVVVTKVTNTKVTYFAGYATITESVDKFNSEFYKEV